MQPVRKENIILCPMCGQFHGTGDKGCQRCGTKFTPMYDPQEEEREIHLFAIIGAKLKEEDI